MNYYFPHFFFFFFFNDTATTEIYTLSLHDALPIFEPHNVADQRGKERQSERRGKAHPTSAGQDRKSTRLNSSHVEISYAVFCLKKKIFTILADQDPADVPPDAEEWLADDKLARAGGYFFNDSATTEIYTLSLHDALPIPPHVGGSVMISVLTAPLPSCRHSMSTPTSGWWG